MWVIGIDELPGLNWLSSSPPKLFVSRYSQSQGRSLFSSFLTFNHMLKVIFFTSSLFLHITVILFLESFVIVDPGWERLFPPWIIMHFCFDVSRFWRSNSFSIHEIIKPSLFLCFELRISAIPVDWYRNWSYILMVDCCFSCWKAFVWV